MTLQEIVDQLKACGYTCEGGNLEHNIAFQELEALARSETSLRDFLNDHPGDIEPYIVKLSPGKVDD